MADETDLHVGKRLRRRRRLLGMTQQDLATQVGVRFQQIQKYECGANRITASRLYELAKAMNVSVQYFFDGMPAAGARMRPMTPNASKATSSARRKRWNWSVPTTGSTSVPAVACWNWQRPWKAIRPVTAPPELNLSALDRIAVSQFYLWS